MAKDGWLMFNEVSTFLYEPSRNLVGFSMVIDSSIFGIREFAKNGDVIKVRCYVKAS